MSSHRKISDALLTLRAAVSLAEHMAHIESSAGHPFTLNGVPMVGEYGLALLDPLNEEFLQSQWLESADSQEQKRPNENGSTGCGGSGTTNESRTEHSLGPVQMGIVHVALPSLKDVSRSTSPTDCGTDDQDYIFDHEIFPVQIEPPDDPDELSYAPRILDETKFQQLMDDGLPRSLRMYKWKRIFCIAKDGDLFFTMMEKCEQFKHTLVVLRTTEGNVLGGFASEQWKAQDGFSKRHSYFGTGTCFLFSDFPENSDMNKDLSVYKWSGCNDYCQICDPDKRQIAMGGGAGDFGLVIDDSFLRGSTGHCATFNNPPLVPGVDGTFDVLEFEVYGLMPLLPTVSKHVNNQYSSRSLLLD